MQTCLLLPACKNCCSIIGRCGFHRYIASQLNIPYIKPSHHTTITIIGTALLVVLLMMLPSFFEIIEARKGTVLNDYILGWVPAVNVSIEIFTIMWGMALLMLIRAIQDPSVIALYIWTYFFIILTRIATISIFKLDPPVGLIPLRDPLTGIIYGQRVINKDLFYSGHTATLTLIFLTLQRKWDKIIAFIALIALIIFLLVQHVHYAIDIIAAPIFVYFLRKMTAYLLDKVAGQPK